jgi:hypothetical protein
VQHAQHAGVSPRRQDDAAFISADPGYQVGTVTGYNGNFIDGRYLTVYITADCTVAATFTLVTDISYTVSPSAGSNSTLVPSTLQSVLSVCVTPNHDM